MDKIWIKVAAVIGLLLLIGSLVFNIKQYFDNRSAQESISKDLIEMKRLNDNIVRNQSQYVSKEDLEKFARNLELDLDTIKNDLSDFDAQIQAISVVLTSSLGRKQTDVPSSGTNPGENVPPQIPCPDGFCPDPYGHLTNSQHLSLSEPFAENVEAPIGSVTFETWKERPWSLDIKPRDYNVITVLGEDEEGRHYAYNKFEIHVDGKKYPVQITNAQMLEEKPEPRFHWWNPRVGLGLSGGVAFATKSVDESVVKGSVTPAVSFSPFSYGSTKKKPDLVVARVGAGYDAANDSLSFSVAPVMWNLGSKIDFIQNTYIGPVVGGDIDGNISVGAGITTDF